MYRRLGVALVELLRGKTAVPIDAAVLGAAVERGPVMLFASHTGNWEGAAASAARFLASRGRALHVVAKPMHSAFFDRWLARLRREQGVSVIPPSGAMRNAVEALHRGDVVVMPIDQVPDRAAHGISTMFLGAPAEVDRAPAVVAYRARATVLVVVEGQVIDIIAAPAKADLEWVSATALRATASLERAITAAPASWMWLHRRWRRPLVA
jgi:KDO2-lipid IV(A) lauroyltransferase